MKNPTILDSILYSIVESVDADLSRCGLMYHIFSRTKSLHSMQAKLEKKAEMYRAKNKKMQDLLALRVTLYFRDDVEIVHQYLKDQSNFLNETIDEYDNKTFCPQRLNLIMKIPDQWSNEMKMFLTQQYPEFSDLLDLTYEIQIRTILSEGWHEVEHDLRYKCLDDWDGFNEEARLLNGIFATLENSEWAMLTLFDKLSYSFYKSNSWTNMMRNKMRVRFFDKSLSDGLSLFLTNNHEVAKNLFRVHRSKVIRNILEKEFKFPLKYDTMVHLLNRVELKDTSLAKLESDSLRIELDNIFGKI